MNGTEVLEIKNEELANSEYKYSKEDICSICNVGHAAFERFILILTDEDQKFIQKRPSRNGGHLYAEPILQKFQLWLMKNQTNQGKSLESKNEKNWTSKKELMSNLQISSDTIEQIINDLSIRWPADTQNHIKKGGYHNSEVFYDDYLVNMITAELAKHNTNQNTGVIQKQMSTEAKEQGILLNAIANSGDLKAAQALCDLIMEKTQIQAENKRLLEQTKQMEHALNYTAVIGWKRWSELKKELAQNFEIFKHRISFKTVAAEAGLVKETDYAERIYGEDCFPTTMISESGIDKIYNCFDR